MTDIPQSAIDAARQAYHRTCGGHDEALLMALQAAAPFMQPADISYDEVPTETIRRMNEYAAGTFAGGIEAAAKCAHEYGETTGGIVAAAIRAIKRQT